METIQLTDSTTVEVISAYAAANQVVPAVVTTPGWYVVGAFYMSATAAARLALIGAVSDAGLLMHARLFDVENAAPVSGSTTADVDGTVDERVVSATFDLVGGRLYQMQVEVVGGVGIGTIKDSSLF